MQWSRPSSITLAAVDGLSLPAVVGSASERGSLGAHRASSLRVSTALGGVWAICALAGLQLVPGVPLASASAAGLTVDEVAQVYGGIKTRSVREVRHCGRLSRHRWL